MCDIAIKKIWGMIEESFRGVFWKHEPEETFRLRTEE